MDNEIESKEQAKSREVDVLGIIKQVLKEKKTLFGFCVAFFIIGVVVAFNTQKYYTTTVLLAPESSNMTGMEGKLGSMTSILGISLNGSAGSDAIYPMLYPDVFASTDFQLSLLNIPVSQQEETTSKPYYKHLVYDGKIAFWDYPKIWLKRWLKKMREKGKPKKSIDEIDFFRLTRDQWELCESLKSLITCVVDKKTEVITLSVTDIDPLVSASVADTVMHRLQDYMTDYRTKKARHDLEYIKDLTEQAHTDYVRAQHAYAREADSHQNVILKAYQTKIENLENEMQLKFNVYTEMSQQLQVARQRVQERTPVFTIIQSPYVPVKASSTPRIFIVAGYVILGIICDAIWVLWLRGYWQERKKKHKVAC